MQEKIELNLNARRSDKLYLLAKKYNLSTKEVILTIIDNFPIKLTIQKGGIK